MDVVKTIVKADGFLGLYAGMESTFWRYALLLRLLPVTSSADMRQ